MLLSRLPSVGAARFRALLEFYKNPVTAMKEFVHSSAVPLSLRSQTKSRVEAQISLTIQKLKDREIFGCYFSHPDYPAGLSDLTEPPPVLFSSNRWLGGRFAAVVGARKAAYSCQPLVKKIVRQLISAGYIVVSGGAVGIDSFAHIASIEAERPTIAVLGNGLDVVYPEANRELFERIKKGGGALLSEFLCGTRPHRSFFPTRNRIIAGLCEVVVIVQAGEKSGSLITANWARKLNRRLFVKKPDSDANGSWDGNRLLINSGAISFTEELPM
ncbi:MAG: hypothetical protein Kow0029_18110 [Candidatus Rifleibacteriota bacterium]